MRFSIILLGIATSTVALAQNPPAPTGSPPSWNTRDPLSLPGDGLPPSWSAVIVPPPVNPNAPPRTSVASPSAAIALQAAQAALAQCKTDGYAIGVAVSNSVGGMVVAVQADGAFPGRVYNAVRKNLVALEFAMPSSAVREKLRAGDFATLARVRPNMTVLPGAVPLLSDDGKVIGAIAVSGAPGAERDEVCARAGAAAVTGKR